MSKKIQAIRGMNDVLPEKTVLWQFLEQQLKQVAHSYGYQEIRFPLLESTSLFKRTVGDVTDIVEKEMYTFADRNGDFLSLRPEGTAGCVRAGLEHGLLHNQLQKFWYLGPMYRHERPQKGRYRQFYQFGLEAFGYESHEVEIEMLLLLARLWKTLGLSNEVRLEINTLGKLSERAEFKRALLAYLEPRAEELDEDSKRRLHTNPLRILDSKNQHTQVVLENAPVLHDFLSQESLDKFEALKDGLDAHDLAFTHNPKLVRGLDYYCHSVFEWVTDSLGAQGTVCAGGRYDGLVELLGGSSTPAVGCAMGIERLIIMLEANADKRELPQNCADLFFVLLGKASELQGARLAENIRNVWPLLRVDGTLNSKASFKSQFKKADKSQARYALVVAEEEAKGEQVTIKALREELPQVTIPQSELIAYLKNSLEL